MKEIVSIILYYITFIANFKNSRKFRFIFRKAFRIAMLLSFLLTLYQYHLYRNRLTKEPKTDALYNPFFYSIIEKCVYIKMFVFHVRI